MAVNHGRPRNGRSIRVQESKSRKKQRRRKKIDLELADGMGKCWSVHRGR